MEWLPIETAPKDGTWILLGYYLEGGGGGHPVVAFYIKDKDVWCDGNQHLNAKGYFSPTHWMSLPSPPEE